MPSYLVTYQLNSPERDYSLFYQAIRSNCNRWWHYLPDVWIVETYDNNATTLANKLYPFIFRTDHLFVAKLAKDFQGWLPTDAWDWLNGVDY